jgi:hypothetical protein
MHDNDSLSVHFWTIQRRIPINELASEDAIVIPVSLFAAAGGSIETGKRYRKVLQIIRG